MLKRRNLDLKIYKVVALWRQRDNVHYTVLYTLIACNNVIRMSVCIECGNKLENDNLFIELSHGQFHLVRCVSKNFSTLFFISFYYSSNLQENCSSIADKYIEYDLVLVLIDIILHRNQAFRHVLFNRKLPDNFVRQYFVDISVLCMIVALQKAVFTVGLQVLLFNAIMKSTALNIKLHHEYSYVILMLLFCSAIEHLIFVGTIFSFLYFYFPEKLNIRHMFDSNCRKVYIALAFPEVGKILAPLFQTWDQDPTLMLFLSVIILSLQFTSLRIVFHNEKIRILGVIFIIGTMVKQGSRLYMSAWYGGNDIRMTGVWLI